LNVFERLQKTTTQAFAVKHTGTSPPEMSVSDWPASPTRLAVPKPSVLAKFGDTKRDEAKGVQSNYTQQDVFERLQKTTTEAYAKKTSKSKLSSRNQDRLQV